PEVHAIEPSNETPVERFLPGVDDPCCPRDLRDSAVEQSPLAAHRANLTVSVGRAATAQCLPPEQLAFHFSELLHLVQRHGSECGNEDLGPEFAFRQRLAAAAQLAVGKASPEKAEFADKCDVR